MRIFAVILIAVALLGCTRPESKSKISIQMPDRAAFLQSIKSQEALPASKKACFGINVTGSGISASTPGITCGGVGLYSGFVGEGEVLQVSEVPNGDKTFELLVYLVDLAQPCPAFNLGSIQSERANLYSSGSTTANIAGDTTITISLNFPGESSSLATTCTSLKAKLLASGDLIDSSGATLAESSPTNEGFFKTPFSGPLSLGIISSGGYVNMTSDNLKIPDGVHSLTQKPDTGSYYGLRHDNSIVKLNLVAGVLSVEEIAAGSCPFSTTDCKVPLWVQSISAGYSTDLYGLDHGGGIHSMTASGPVATPVNVGPNVTQVSYY